MYDVYPYEVTENGKLYTYTKCTSCDGTGREWFEGCGDTDYPCDDCDGHGARETIRNIDK